MPDDNIRNERSNSSNASSDTIAVTSTPLDAEEKPDPNGDSALPEEQKRAETGPGTGQERNGSKQIITLPLSDPEHPNNWSKTKKALVITGSIVTVIHSTLGSALPSNAVPYIAEEFHVTSEIQMVLPISCFLMGYVFAPTLCGPLSENFGRKPVMLTSFIGLNLFTMSCAVAPSWGSFLFFRFLCGILGSAPMACVSGIFADIDSDPRIRGRTMAIFMCATVLGPTTAPLLSGFIAENTTWRWVFGVGTIFAAATLPVVISLPETYAPILLSKRAAKMRAETGNPNIIAQSDLQKKSFGYVVTVVLSRPFKMLFRELIVSTTCAYLSLCYGIFYLYFEAYPIIFLGPTSVYKFSPGIAGLMFLPVTLGSVLAGALFIMWDVYLARAQKRKEPWSEREEYRRLPLALIGGPMYALSILWLGWSAREGVFWLAPAASGVLFGAGFILLFMGMLNYLSDAYMTYAASAQGIASSCRSLLGVLLPLAAGRMFSDLGIAWACSTLAFLAFALGTVPFFFVRFGQHLRDKSKFRAEIHALHQKELEQKEQLEREALEKA